MGVDIKSEKVDDYKTMTGYFNVVHYAKYKTTVTYPEDNDDLYIGIGGSNSKDSFYTDADIAFWHALGKFGKTTAYKGGEKNSRWQKVSNIK